MTILTIMMTANKHDGDDDETNDNNSHCMMMVMRM